MIRKVRVNITLDEDLVEQLRSKSDLNVSRVCNEALKAAIAAMQSGRPETVTFATVERRMVSFEITRGQP